MMSPPSMPSPDSNVSLPPADDVERILALIRDEETIFPDDFFVRCRARKAELADRLVELLDASYEDPELDTAGARAMALLADFGDGRLFDRIVIDLETGWGDDFGDEVTEVFSGYLAAVAGDRLRELEPRILDRSLHWVARATLVDAWALGVDDGRIPRDAALAFLAGWFDDELAGEGRDRETTDTWVATAFHLCAVELDERVRRLLAPARPRPADGRPMFRPGEMPPYAFLDDWELLVADPAERDESRSHLEDDRDRARLENLREWLFPDTATLERLEREKRERERRADRRAAEAEGKRGRVWLTDAQAKRVAKDRKKAKAKRAERKRLRKRKK